MQKKRPHKKGSFLCHYIIRRNSSEEIFKGLFFP
nr:MAG TPA_asm: hypothetical protein [Bacteriophage sp.]